VKDGEEFAGDGSMLGSVGAETGDGSSLGEMRVAGAEREFSCGFVLRLKGSIWKAEETNLVVVLEADSKRRNHCRISSSNRKDRLGYRW